MEREQEDEVASYEDVREIQITKNSEKLQRNMYCYCLERSLNLFITV
jgi:hypothetical protein